MYQSQEMTILFPKLTKSPSLFSEDSLRDQDVTMLLLERRMAKQLNGKCCLKRAQSLHALELLTHLAFITANATSLVDKMMTPISSMTFGSLILQLICINK